MRLPLARPPTGARPPASSAPSAQGSRLLRLGAAGVFNGNSRWARYAREFERALVAHVGGQPSATQQVLIGRLTRLAVRLEQLDEKLLNGSDPSDHAAREYLAWSNSLNRGLRLLGLHGADPNRPHESIADIALEIESTKGVAP
jgi:hypothetical protein